MRFCIPYNTFGRSFSHFAIPYSTFGRSFSLFWPWVPQSLAAIVSAMSNQAHTSGACIVAQCVLCQRTLGHSLEQAKGVLCLRIFLAWACDCAAARLRQRPPPPCSPPPPPTHTHSLWGRQRRFVGSGGRLGRRKTKTKFYIYKLPINRFWRPHIILIY